MQQNQFVFAQRFRKQTPGWRICSPVTWTLTFHLKQQPSLGAAFPRECAVAQVDARILRCHRADAQDPVLVEGQAAPGGGLLLGWGEGDLCSVFRPGSGRLGDAGGATLKSNGVPRFDFCLCLGGFFPRNRRFREETHRHVRNTSTLTWRARATDRAHLSRWSRDAEAPQPSPRSSLAFPHQSNN